MNTFVQMPDALKVAIGLAIGLLFTWGLMWITVRIPWLGMFLGPYKDAVVGAISSGIVLWIQELLNAIPSLYDNVVLLALQLIAAVLLLILTPLVVVDYLRRRETPGFRF